MTDTPDENAIKSGDTLVKLSCKVLNGGRHAIAIAIFIQNSANRF